MLAVERVKARTPGEKGEDDEEDAHSSAGRAAPVREAGGVRAGGDGAGVDGPRRSSGGGERGGSGGDRRPGDPGARCEARQDRAPRHRGAGGRTAAREGAGRRAGAKAGRREGANSSTGGCIEFSLPLRAEFPTTGLIHRTSWKGNSANFACIGFLEVQQQATLQSGR